METQSTEELHTITGIVYQNILDLTPSLRELATSARQYQKALQNVSSEALKYYQALGKVAQSALASKGSARGLGDAITDMIDVHKNIESQRIGIINYMSSDLIVPLETLTETNPVRVKSCHKGYNHEVKAKTEAVERAKNELNKVRKKSQRKKLTEKYEEKEKQCDEELTKAQKQLDEFRISGCKAALSEERKLHSFVLDRATIIAKSSMEFYDHSAKLLNTKISVWFSLIKKRPDSSAMVIEENGHTSQLGQDVSDGFLAGRIKLRAVFPHTAEEASQLSFKEGDIVDPISDVVSGWQYGENIRTNKHGWFPSQFMEKILAAHTAPTVSQTMPVSGGQHARPPLDAGIPNRSPKLRRYVSGPTPPLPQPDYRGKETKTPGDAPVTGQPTIAAETADTGAGEPSNPVTAPHNSPKMTRSASASGISKGGISKSCTPPPPPPPPPPVAPDDPPESKESEEQASPFAGVRLKKTVTDDRSSPKIS